MQIAKLFYDPLILSAYTISIISTIHILADYILLCLYCTHIIYYRSYNEITIVTILSDG